MSQVIVRNLEDGVKAGLKQRASLHGWSMEEEARQILRKAVLADSTSSIPLGSRIAARFAGCGLVEDLPELPKPFKKGNIIEAEVVLPGRLGNEMLAVAKDRLISVPECFKEIGSKVRLKIKRSKHNIFLGELLN